MKCRSNELLSGGWPKRVQYSSRVISCQKLASDEKHPFLIGVQLILNKYKLEFHGWREKETSRLKHEK